MKKILVTFVMLMALLFSAQAQQFRYGVSAGYNLNSMVENESKSGFHAGLKGEYAFRSTDKGLYTDFGLMISSYGWKSPTAYENGTGKVFKWDTTPYYLNIPIHLGYKFKVGDNVSLFVNVGPHFNIGMFGKTRYTTTYNGSKIEEGISSNNVFKEGMIPRFDWGVGFRIGAEIARHTQISIGYDWSMKNSYLDNPDTKNRTLVVSLTYYF